MLTDTYIHAHTIYTHSHITERKREREHDDLSKRATAYSRHVRSPDVNCTVVNVSPWSDYTRQSATVYIHITYTFCFRRCFRLARSNEVDALFLPLPLATLYFCFFFFFFNYVRFYSFYLRSLLVYIKASFRATRAYTTRPQIASLLRYSLWLRGCHCRCYMQNRAIS